MASANADWNPIQTKAIKAAEALGHRVEYFRRERRTPGVRTAHCETCHGCCWVTIDDEGGKAGGRLLKYRCGTPEAAGFKGEPTGADLIAAERQRQIEKERWTPEHDDEHVHGEIASAASEYINAAHNQYKPNTRTMTQVRRSWPWDAKWWKPAKDPIRNLVKAGALIAAEIDRLKRLEKKAEEIAGD